MSLEEYTEENTLPPDPPRMSWEEFVALRVAQSREHGAAERYRDKAKDRINVSNPDTYLGVTEADWDEEDTTYNAYLLGAGAGEVQVAGSVTTLMKAVGGPYDGMPINVPPGGTSVAMPSAFGAGDLHGSSIYERYITDEGITVMRYVGQGNQTDEEDAPKLILP